MCCKIKRSFKKNLESGLISVNALLLQVVHKLEAGQLELLDYYDIT